MDGLTARQYICGMQYSVWEKETFYAPADVLIVGAGFTGLWSAYHLKKAQPALNILILERGSVPAGASSRNAGFACFGSLTELLADTRQSGTDAMLELAEMRFRGLEQISRIAARHKVDLELNGGYELIDAGNPVSDLEDSISWLNDQLKTFLGTSTCFSIADHQIPAFGFKDIQHLILNRHEGTLHPGKLLQALQHELTSMGVRILYGIGVDSYMPQSGQITVNSSEFTFSCANLLLCTNAFTASLLNKVDILPARGQVIVVQPERPPAFSGSFHYDEGFYYFRNHGDRIILGGARNKDFEREATATSGITDTIRQHLETFLQQKLIPGQRYLLTDHWSGIMAMGSSKAPILDRIEPQVFLAARMSGMGVALAPVAGEKIARMILK